MGSRPDGPPPGPARLSPPRVVRIAGLLLVVEGALGVGFAGFLVVRSLSLGSVAMFLLIGAALLLVGFGLLRGRFWARTPAIVVQLLLLPVVYSLIGPSRQVLAGVLAALVVSTALLLLISGRARTWAIDLDEARRRGG